MASQSNTIDSYNGSAWTTNIAHGTAVAVNSYNDIYILSHDTASYYGGDLMLKGNNESSFSIFA